MKLPSNRKYIALSLAIIASLYGANPVQASGSGSTALSMIVTSSTPPASLNISAPLNLNLGSNVSFPSTFTATFPGAVTVTDTRASSAGWTSQVIVSALTPASGPSIPASVFSYAPGSITPIGTGTLTGATASSVTTAATVVTATVVSGNVGASWTPTLTLTEPGAPATGTYTGTVTSSVF